MYWKINEENIITIISDTPNFKLFYMKDDLEFIELLNGIDKGDNLYLYPHTFTEVGNYTIKLFDTSNGDVRYNQIKVLSDSDFNVMLTGTEYSNVFNGPNQVFTKGL